MPGEQQAGGVEGRSHLPRRSGSQTQSDGIPQVQVEVEAEAVASVTDQVEHTQDQDSPRHLLEDSATGAARTAAAVLSRQSSSCSNVATPASSQGAYFVLPDRRSPAPRATRSLEPPVTKGTLSELDVTKIIHNPKLRHDINFDPELHFRPNIDGEKGRRKQDKANQFWTALLEQLIEFVTDRETFYAKYGQNDDWCLPSLLRAVKDIIQTLVPVRDRVYLEEGLNVELLMQQFNKGIADLEKLATWLSRVLKSHCAPMRDEWVDEMYNQLSNGNRTNNMDELVRGMRSLLSVLEAMKLDVANHQIRCLRPVLIEDTVHFEQRFFFKKIQSGKVEVRTGREWYRRAEMAYARQPLSTDLSSHFGDMTPFFAALTELMLPSGHEKPIPQTFLFDEDRLIKLRADVLDAVNLELCMRLYEDIERQYPRTAQLPSFLSNQAPQLDDVNYSPPNSRPASFVFSSAGSSNSSPRSSWCMVGLGEDLADARRRSRELYSSLVALLHSSPPTSPKNRWLSMAPSLALQIHRNTSAPLQQLSEIENRLASLVSNYNSDEFRQVENFFRLKLIRELAIRVKEFKTFSGVGLFSAATGGRIQGPGRAWDTGREQRGDRESSENSGREAREDAGVEDMATRLAHLGVLHWRVWAQLAYSNNTDINEMNVDSDETRI